jgi:hypothetical protein
MGRARLRNDTRSRIAHLAARLMAEDGIEDYGLAKRKAARQAGVADARQLPDNDEIDAALRSYQELYRPDEHRSRLKRLREKALAAMRALAQFNPFLTGSVLSGSAGKYADIDLQLFTDNVKAVELFLIDRGIRYRTADSWIYVGETLKRVPVFAVNDDGVDILLTVFSSSDMREPLRSSPEGRTMERAKAHAVVRLLAET